MLCGARGELKSFRIEVSVCGRLPSCRNHRQSAAEHLLSARSFFRMKAGSRNTSRSGSSVTFSNTFCATCAKISIPTISMVRKVAVFGRPIKLPVNRSTSSMVRPKSRINWMVRSAAYSPIRLAMKFGVSFARTTPLPSMISANCSKARSAPGSVSGVRIISVQLPCKTWRIEEMGAKPVAAEVFRTPNGQTGHAQSRGVRREQRTRFAHLVDPGSSRVRLISAFSTTASIVQSDSRNRIRPSWKEAASICRMRSGRNKGEGDAFSECPLYAFLGGLLRDVEQQDGITGICKMGGNLRPHRSCSKHSRFAYDHCDDHPPACMLASIMSQMAQSDYPVPRTIL